jgi:hypothetical protein
MNRNRTPNPKSQQHVWFGIGTLVNCFPIKMVVNCRQILWMFRLQPKYHFASDISHDISHSLISPMISIPNGPIAICSRLNLPLVPFSAPQPRDQRPASPVALPTMVCLYDNRSPQSPVKVDGCLQVEHVEFPVLSVSLGPYEILWTSVSFPGLVPHCSHEASPLTVNSTSAKRFSNAAARIASSEFSFAPWKQKPLRPIYYL